MIEIVGEEHAEGLSILERLRGSLARAGLQRVSGVSDQHDAVAAPGREVGSRPGWVDGVDVRVCDDAADDRVGPGGMSGLQLAADDVFVEVPGVGKGFD